MAIMNFPENPSVGDIYTFEGYKYRWSGVKWQSNWVRSDTSLDLFKSELASEGSTVLVGGAVAGDFGDTVNLVNEAKAAGTLTSPVLSGIAHGTTMLSHRNLLINGDFRIWQRGDTVTVKKDIAAYTADRWQVWSTGSDCYVHKTQWASAGIVNKMEIWGDHGNTWVQVVQRIESANIGHCVGKKLTVSFNAAITGVTGKQIGVYFHTMNNKDDASALTSLGYTDIPVDGNLNNRYTFTITATEAVFNGLVLTIGVAGGLGNGQGLNLDKVQLELGEVATPFEHRPYSYELALCQRYFEILHYPGNDSLLAGGNLTGVNSFNLVARVDFKVPKRVPPTLVNIRMDTQGGSRNETIDVNHIAVRGTGNAVLAEIIAVNGGLIGAVDAEL